MSIDVTNLYDRRADNRWERVCAGDLLERMTWSAPDKDAIVGWAGAYADPAFERVSYRRANEVANQVAAAILARGLSRGDRVLFGCENSVEGYLGKLAAAKAGLVAVPINPSMAGDVIEDLLRRTQPKFSIVDAEVWPRLEGAFDAVGLSPDVTIEIGGGPVRSSIGFSELIDGQPDDEPDVRIHGDDIWEILFTSGTTSMPKGAMFSHTSSTFSAYGFALSLTRGLRFESDLVLGTFLPMMYHIGHTIFVLSAFVSGGTVVLGRKPDHVATAAAIERERITALWAGSPAMVGALYRELEDTGRDAGCLTTAVYGWGALPPEVLDGMKKHCAENFVATGIFGQTEAIACHRFWPDKWREVYERTAPAVNYVGIPSPLLASRVVDPEGRPLDDSPGVAGEAVYRSPSVAAGYYQDERSTAEAFRDGWFHSGDSCYRDEDGLRVMVDRYKDIVKTGGENVSTIRVESVLAMHPAVLKAAVIGVPHETWGEQVTAIVVLKEPGTLTEDELIAYARERLAGFETPKAVVFTDGLPETVGGKVMKYKLRELYR